MPEIQRDGITIFYDDVGDGPAIVLGHSFLCSGEMWAEQVGPLSERYRVLNVDQRGHGRSGDVNGAFDLSDMVGDVTAVLDDAGVDCAVWCGLSIGGMVAMLAALTVPDRVRALIIVDSHAGSETTYKKFKYRAMNVGAKIFGIRPFLPAVQQLMFGKTTTREQPDLVREWGERFASVHLPSIGTTLGALVRRDSVIDRLGEIEVPALVVVGEEDRSLPPPCSEEIAAALPNAKLVRIPMAGHLSALEQPEPVTSAILDFLRAVG
jgi:pimeloyl-ACP methyl ester carboxylesterase